MIKTEEEKEQNRARVKEWRKKNRKKVQEQNRKYYQRHKEEVNERNKENHRKVMEKLKKFEPMDPIIDSIKRKRCPMCNTILKGNYCHNCGQATNFQMEVKG